MSPTTLRIARRYGIPPGLMVGGHYREIPDPDCAGCFLRCSARIDIWTLAHLTAFYTGPHF